MGLQEQLRRETLSDETLSSVSVSISDASPRLRIGVPKQLHKETEDERFEHHTWLRTIKLLIAYAALFVEQTPLSKHSAHDKWTVRDVAMYYDAGSCTLYRRNVRPRIIDNLNLLSRARKLRMETASKAPRCFPF